MPKSTITGKSQLIQRISKKTKFPQTQITQIIDELLLETKKALVKGEEVRLQGYFSLKTAITKPRMAMNLQTKKKMKVPAKRVPKCKFSISLKEEINKESLELKSKKTPKTTNIMATRTIKLKQLNLNPLSVAKYFYEKLGARGIEQPFIHPVLYLAYREILKKENISLFKEEFEA
ncbi:8194_t:CDS:2 [Funneliformis caledonium]|uniref:8194_t:CDS:1 n=1 Tax=Funneliformis caledonium TaxID=1117310 RepID=A0A9N9I8I7_9GLOM|nr:8194_t:CDS:2 [Funneliformis caledonium]